MTDMEANIAGIKQTQHTLLGEVDALIQPLRKASVCVCVCVCVRERERERERERIIL